MYLIEKIKYIMYFRLRNSSCEFGIEPSGSINCWETIECPNN
jgi:hypothetical protein